MEAVPSVVVPGRRLGKLAPKHDPRTLRFASYVKPHALPPIPAEVDRIGPVLARIGVFPMLANDRLGDCTCASSEHIDIATETLGGHVGLPADERERQTIALYSRVTGYDPQTGANDNGAMLLDVLKALSTTGYDGEGKDTIGAYVSVDPLNEEHLRAALYLFGVLYTGVNLPVSAQAEVGRVWSATTGVGSEPGSWGGHAIFTGKITATERECITWGARQRMTRAWQERYMDEAWTFITPDFITAAGKTVDGFDLAGLMVDIAAIKKP